MEIYEKIPLPLPLLLLLLLIKIIVKIILIFVSLLLTLSLECQHDSVQRGEESSSLQYSRKYGIVLLPDSFFFVINPEINKNVHITIKKMKTRFLQLTRDIYFQVTSIIQDPALSPRTFDKIDVKALGRAISPLSVIF